MDMRKVKLDKLNPSQLDSLIKKAEKAKKARKAAPKAASINARTPSVKRVTDTIAAVAKKEKVSNQEVLDAAAKRLRIPITIGKSARKPSAATGRKKPVKFRHPDDNSLTWAGVGKRPRWLEAELKAGKKLESFAV